MKNKKIVVSVCLVIFLFLTTFFLPVKQALSFTETRTDNARMYYVLMDEQNEFKIRYVHSIHLTDVLESYEVTASGKIRMLSMTYENLAVGLPGDAGEGETLTLNNGLYTLTYDDKVIDSFTMRIGKVAADLTFRYGGNEIDLKERLEKGKSYEFKTMKLTIYQLLKGENLNDKR